MRENPNDTFFFEKCYISIKFARKWIKTHLSHFLSIQVSFLIPLFKIATRTHLDALPAIFRTSFNEKQTPAQLRVSRCRYGLSGSRRISEITPRIYGDCRRRRLCRRFRIWFFIGHIPPLLKYGIKIKSEIKAAPMPTVSSTLAKYSLMPLVLMCLCPALIDPLYRRISSLRKSSLACCGSWKYSLSCMLQFSHASKSSIGCLNLLKRADKEKAADPRLVNAVIRSPKATMLISASCQQVLNWTRIKTAPVSMRLAVQRYVLMLADCWPYMSTVTRWYSSAALFSRKSRVSKGA